MRRRSPQIGLVSSATTVASGISPTLRGWAKWSLKVTEYKRLDAAIRLSDSDLNLPRESVAETSEGYDKLKHIGHN